jgi:hypothetical protein
MYYLQIKEFKDTENVGRDILLRMIFYKAGDLGPTLEGNKSGSPESREPPG